MLKNLASAIFLTERDAEHDANKPKIKGRIVTTLHKAKEVRSLVEKTITIAKKALIKEEAAAEFGTQAKRQSEEWKKWAQAMAPVVHARRRCIQLLGDKQAVSLLFSTVAPRFKDREGGYTRVLRLAKPRLGDAGIRGILEFTGIRDRKVQKSEKPAFDEAAAT